MTLLRGIMHSLGVDVSASTMWRPLALQTIAELTRGVVVREDGSPNIECGPGAESNGQGWEGSPPSSNDAVQTRTDNDPGLLDPGSNVVVVSPSLRHKMGIGSAAGSPTQSPSKRALQVEEVGELAKHIRAVWVQKGDV